MTAKSRVATTKAQIITVYVEDLVLTLDLLDGRAISVPLAWYPRLAHGSAEERNRWQLMGG